MRNYVTSSLEVHLFFGRIMKEHSLFLMAGFPSGEKEMISRADWFRQEFEKLWKWRYSWQMAGSAGTC